MKYIKNFKLFESVRKNEMKFFTLGNDEVEYCTDILQELIDDDIHPINIEGFNHDHIDYLFIKIGKRTYQNRNTPLNIYKYKNSLEHLISYLKSNDLNLFVDYLDENGNNLTIRSEYSKGNSLYPITDKFMDELEDNNTSYIQLIFKRKTN